MPVKRAAGSFRPFSVCISAHRSQRTESVHTITPQTTLAALLGYGPHFAALQRLGRGEALADDVDCLEGFWDLPDRLSAGFRQAGLADFDPGQPASSLSGGERVKALLCGAFLSAADYLLLDEPTTWLDISHQIDLLELMRQLNRENGHTLVVVLHDLNHACRYATHLIAMRDGKVVAEGAPKEIVTAELIEEVYGLRCMIIDDPVSHTPLVVPLGKS